MTNLQDEPRETGGEAVGERQRGEQRSQGAPRAERGRRRILCGCSSQERQIFDRRKVAVPC